MRVALAQTRFPQTIDEGTRIVLTTVSEAAQQQCDIICFPESIIPGLRGVGYSVEPYDHSRMMEILDEVRFQAQRLGISVILPMEWKDHLGLHIVAFVISGSGEILGYQTKNQYDPDEDRFGYVPSNRREVFEINGVTFGIVICHEGWRYPETVRWAARQGATIVFHPQFTGLVDNPQFYQGAMVCRSQENNIFFASVNYAIESQSVTTSLISPFGERLTVADPGREQLLVWDIDPGQASGLLANRYHPELF